LAYLLYDLLSNDSNGSVDTQEQTILFDSFPWPMKQFFKQVMKKTIQYTNELSNFDINKILSETINLNPREVWSSSSNSTWKVSHLIEYVNWFSNFIEDIKDDKYCGHMHERSLSFYYFLNKLKVFNAPRLMTHYQLNTHGTSPLPPERFQTLYTNLK
jgi:hypothetical protein